MEHDVLQEFRESCYVHTTADFLQQVSAYIESHDTQLLQQIQEYLEVFLRAVRKGQERLPIPVGSIQISLLKTSILLEKPQLQMDAFDEMGVLGNRLFSKGFPIPWLTEFWESYKEALMKNVADMKAQRFLSEERIENLMGENVDYLIAFLTGLLKYFFIQEGSKIAGIHDIEKADNFMISLGSYYDRQKMLYAELPEVDIFYNPQEEGLEFVSFHQKIYSRKEFKQLRLYHTRFVECQFVNCSFVETDLSDAYFDNCRFYQTGFENCTAYGSTFKNCIFDRVTITKVDFHYEGEADHRVKDIYKPLDIYDSQLQQVSFQQCNLAYARVEESLVKDMRLEECCIEKSTMEGNVNEHGIFETETEQEDESSLSDGRSGHNGIPGKSHQ